MSGIDQIKALQGKIEDWKSERRHAAAHTPTFASAVAQALNRASREIGEKNPGHLALPGSALSTAQFHARTVDLLAQRQQLIAANIANADTPAYQATDFNMDEAIQRLTGVTAPPLTLAGSTPRHLAPPPLTSFQQIAARYYTPHQPSADGNTVDMDAERAKLADNAVRYQFSLTQANGESKELLTMLKDLR